MKYWEIVRKFGLVLPAGVLLACTAVSLTDYEIPSYESLIPDISLAETVDAAQKKEGRPRQSSLGGAVGQDASGEAQEAVKLELPPAEDSGALYRDGTYTGTGTGYGGAVTVQVVVENGRIASVSVLGNQETPEFLQRALVLCDRIVSAQSTNVDTVSGATLSSGGIIGGARKALAKAATEKGAQLLGEDGSATASGKSSGSQGQSSGSKSSRSKKASSGSDAAYKDGDYVGTAAGFSGDISVKVTIKGGKITSVKVIDSVDDAAFLNRAKTLLPKIVSAQSTDLDAVSGATYSSNGILDAVEDALSKARAKTTGGTGSKTKGTGTGGSGDSGSKTSGTKGSGSSGGTSSGQGKGDSSDASYKDGTFTGTGTGFSGELGVSVTIKGGRITSVKVTDSADDAAFLNRAKTLLPQIVSSQSADIDVVSGATYSSNGILEAVKSALAKASKNTDSGSSDGGSTSGKGGSGGSEQTDGGGTGSSTQTGGGNADSSSRTSGNKGAESREDGGGASGTNEALYLDGVYSGTGEGFSGDLSVSVTIQDGRLSAVEVTESADDAAFLNRAKGLLPRIVSAQSTDVDVVSGATYSSNGILEAVSAALAKAQQAAVGSSGSNGNGSAGGDSGDSAGGSGGAGGSANGSGSNSGGGGGGSTSENGSSSGGSGSSSGGSGTEGNGTDSENGENGGTPASSGTDEPPALFADGTYAGTALCEPDEDEDFWEYSLDLEIVVKDDTIIEIKNVQGRTYGDNTYSSGNDFFINRAVSGVGSKPGLASQLAALGRLEGIDAVSGVDAISGATCSSQAVIGACRDALNKATAALED